jgi:putative transcriptional regulator
MTKRDMFAELIQGIGDLKQEREGKITLRTTSVEEKPRLEITPQEIVSLRVKLHVSRAVFARMIRTNPRTLERWEQGKSKPDQGSRTLLKLVQSHPETLEMIAAL